MLHLSNPAALRSRLPARSLAGLLEGELASSSNVSRFLRSLNYVYLCCKRFTDDICTHLIVGVGFDVLLDVLFYFEFVCRLEMAAQFFNRIGQLGFGIAVAAGVVNSALYNGKCWMNPSYMDLIVFLISFFLFLCVLCAVEGGHRAVIFDRFSGVLNQVVGEGTHFYVPWVQRPIMYDIRSRPRNVPVITGSKGLLVFVSFFFFAI